MNSEEQFHAIVEDLPDAKAGKMFGVPCIKAPNGKAAAVLHDDAMVFKLRGADLEEARAIPGAVQFDPMGGKPMKEWVVVPNEQSERWEDLAKAAYAYVREL